MSIGRISANTTMSLNLDTLRNNQDINKNNVEIPSSLSEKMNNKVFDSSTTLSKENVNEVIEKINTFLEPTNTSIKFKLHEDLNEYYVTIVDQKTDEVIREIPSKKILDIYAAMTEFLGLMVDRKI